MWSVLLCLCPARARRGRTRALFEDLRRRARVRGRARDLSMDAHAGPSRVRALGEDACVAVRSI